MRLPSFITDFVLGKAREYGTSFAQGWAEGTRRWRERSYSPEHVSGSEYDKGTVAFAASQAAVAFYEGLER